MSKVGLDKGSQHKLKGVSKLIAVIAKICRIFIYIAIPFIIIAAIITPTVINHTHIKNDTIVFKYGNESFELDKVEGKVVSYYNGEKLKTTSADAKAYKLAKKTLDKYSKRELIGYTEAAFIYVITYLVLIILTLKHLGKLFKNISRGTTPFTLDNIEHMRRMSKYMICAIILPMIVSILYLLVADIDFGINFGLIDVVEILFVLAMSFVFKYGYELQNESKTTIYDED